MSGWITIEEDNVKLIHHSTSSTVELVMDEGKDSEQKFWMDYYGFEKLKRALIKLEELEK